MRVAGDRKWAWAGHSPSLESLDLSLLESDRKPQKSFKTEK